MNYVSVCQIKKTRTIILVQVVVVASMVQISTFLQESLEPCGGFKIKQHVQIRMTIRNTKH